MRVCIVGAGAAGIVASKHLLLNSIEFDVFEKTDKLGGIWVYSESSTDGFGNAYQTPMYKGLRTNLPKQLMEFEGHSFGTTDSSYPKHEVVLKYLQDYAVKFQLNNKIKFGHIVKKILFDQDKWKVIIENVAISQEETLLYDSIFVCNGHFHDEKYPVIEGRNLFKGIQMHSKMYRKPEIFSRKSVLIIGYGPSGQDITMEISSFADKVYLSNHNKNFKAEVFRKNVISKPDVAKLNENSILFQDGSEEDVDVIIYCTGFHYTFPFLDSSCGITVDDGYVKPLHEHLININHPTMFFIGLRFTTFIFPMLETQVKVSINLLLKKSEHPSYDKMINELKLFEKEKSDAGYPKKKYHQIDNLETYFENLRKLGGLSPLPKVYFKIYYDCFNKRKTALHLYRFYQYNVLDEETFTVRYLGPI